MSGAHQSSRGQKKDASMRDAVVLVYGTATHGGVSES